jgi:CRP-like cAMP-binding protein
MLPESITEKFIFKSDAIFANLPNNIKELFLNQMQFREYKKGQNLFTEGTYPSGIYFIKKGKVKKYKSLNGGKEQIIYVCCEGELLGYASLLGEETYPDSASSLTNAVIGFLPKDRLLKLIEKYDEISKMLVKNLSHEFGVLINFIAAFTQKPVRERVALTLLILWDKFRDHQTESTQVQILLTREDLANMVGTAVETLVRVLHEFKKEKIISTSGRAIQLLDIPELIEISRY